METREGPEPITGLLEKKYKLDKAPEVKAAARLRERHTGEPIGSPRDRIQVFLDRFKGLTTGEDLEESEKIIRDSKRNVIKRALHEKYVIKPDAIPESYWTDQIRIAREQGQGADLELVNWDKLKEQQTRVIIADQHSSLDSWIDYLSSSDAPYAESIKYFVLRSVLGLGKYDKETKGFPKRSSGMTQPFPELNREALAYVIDILVKKYTPQYFELSDHADQTQLDIDTLETYEKTIDRKRAILAAIPPEIKDKVITVEIDGKKQNVRTADIAKMRASLEPPARTNKDEMKRELDDLKSKQQELLRAKGVPETFLGLPEDEDFGKLYAYAIQEVTPTTEKDLTNIQGRWIKYSRGSDHIPLVTSLQGHGTGWCTAGESTAKTQLNQGDFYVYYSIDHDGKPTIPRVAIRMEGSDIAEMRGIAPEQNFDRYIAPVVEEKLKEFGGEGNAYKKKVADMRQLTDIDHKIEEGSLLTVAEIKFLYEMDSPIEGFGYKRDPRIKELRNKRKKNLDDDVSVIYGCESSQIAHSPSEIREGTKVYIGPLVEDILDRLAIVDVEHFCPSFPEMKDLPKKDVDIKSVNIGGKNSKQLQYELEQASIRVGDFAEGMIRDLFVFKPIPTDRRISILRLKVHTLGFSEDTPMHQVFKKAQEMGLRLCPDEVGIQYILQYPNQIEDGESLYIASEGIIDYEGNPLIFKLGRSHDSLSLNDKQLGSKCKPSDEFLFSIPKFDTEETPQL